AGLRDRAEERAAVDRVFMGREYRLAPERARPRSGPTGRRPTPRASVIGFPTDAPDPRGDWSRTWHAFGPVSAVERGVGAWAPAVLAVVEHPAGGILGEHQVDVIAGHMQGPVGLLDDGKHHLQRRELIVLADALPLLAQRAQGRLHALVIGALVGPGQQFAVGQAQLHHPRAFVGDVPEGDLLPAGV